MRQNAAIASIMRWRRLLEAFAVLAVAGLAFVALQSLVHEVRWGEIVAALHAVGWKELALAIAFTSLSYFLLTLYDMLALRIIGRPLRYRTAALASLTSYALSHNLGLTLLTGGTARYRIYTAAGLQLGEILRVIALASMTFWSGVFAMGAVALLVHADPLQLGPLVVTPQIQHALGIALLLALVAGFLFLRGHGSRIPFTNWSLPQLSTHQALAQPLLAACDLAAASAALFVLVPDVGPAQFPMFFLGYTLALIAALVTHVPGGVGVFEAVTIAMLPGHDKASLLAALILYRMVYYLLPLAIVVVLLAVHERRRLRGPVDATLGAAEMVLHVLAPTFLALMALIGGLVLLVSGSLPGAHGRLDALRDVLPLPFVEASHIVASLVGTGLLLLAPGIYRRLDAAFLLTRALLLAGAAFSLAKGFDYEEALILLAMAGVLQLARPAFYRHTALTTALGSAGSVAAIGTCVILTVWIGFFAYRHVDYQSQLWWEFAWHGDASRFLRATFAIAVLLICVAISRLLSYAQAQPESGDTDIDAGEAALRQCTSTTAFLAYTGDKRFLHSPSGMAMLMYQVQGRSWIVMGDPVGPRAEWADLLWRIREMADAAQGRLLLYQIGLEMMPLAVDLGLSLVKYGEEARVFLPDFSLDGPDRKDLRYAERRAEREGAEFSIVPAAEVPAILDELRALSDAWLKEKGQDEKAFSVGRFDPAYLARFDCAVVRHRARIIAFANIWATEGHEELSIDLMRHAAAIPHGIMDYLFLSLMKWGQSEGYRWFSLGLAPLSGIEARRLAPIWARIGGLLYRHGATFYSFEGLRTYKEKFAPVWESRYIAAPNGLGLVRGLVDLQMLIAGRRNSAASPRRLTRAV